MEFSILIFSDLAAVMSESGASLSGHRQFINQEILLSQFPHFFCGGLNLIFKHVGEKTWSDRSQINQLNSLRVSFVQE